MTTSALLRIALVLALVSLLEASLCSKRKTCSACTQDQNGCLWCELDNHCYSGTSRNSPCSFSEGIINSTYCGCNGTPQRKYGIEVCGWYTEKSENISSDVSTWKGFDEISSFEFSGGDFLLDNIAEASSCACHGNGSPLWLTDAASCVRSSILDQHKAIPSGRRVLGDGYLQCSDTKIAMRHEKLSGDSNEFKPFMPMILDIHKKAYSKCYCVGTAGYDKMWNFLLHKKITCSILIDSILAYGRCGCGW